METVLLLVILLPMLGAIVAASLRGRLLHGWAVIIALATMALSLYAIWPQGLYSTQYVLGSLPWIKGVKEQLFGLLLDPLSAIMLMVITILGLLVVLYSTEYLGPDNVEHPTRNGRRRYYFWLLLFIGSMTGVALSPNLLQLFIFWEMTTVCSWALIGHYQDAKGLRAGFKALIMTHVGGLCFLAVLLMTFAMTRSFSFRAVEALPVTMQGAAFFLLLVAAWAKSAQIPFHTWLPDAMEAPTPISAYLHAAAMVKAGVYLMARMVSAGWAMPAGVSLAMAGMALLTMFVAVMFYFGQDDLKRLLAYSTIAHLGYVLLGVSLGALGSTVGFQGGVLHIICHAAGKCTLFLCAGAIAYSVGTRSIRQLSGLGRKMPLVATGFFIGLIAVTGVPPFSCFWSKFFILSGAFQMGGVMGPLLLILIAVESMISFGWFLWVGQKVFLGEPSPLAAKAADPRFPMSTVLVICMILCLAAPWLGMPFTNIIKVGVPLIP